MKNILNNLENKLEKVAQEVCPADWTATVEKGGSSDISAFYKIKWFLNEEIVGFLNLSVAEITQTMYLIDFYVHDSGNNMFKNLCVEMPKLLREIGLNKFKVPVAKTEASQYILDQAGFEKDISGALSADISDPNNSVETYGKLR